MAKTIIFRPWRTLPDGTRLYARKYGLKAWPIAVDDEDIDEMPRRKRKRTPGRVRRRRA